MIFFLLFTTNLSCLFSQLSNFNYGKLITIDASKVDGGSPLINYPLLINVIDNDLKTVANGGHIEHDQGFDIRFGPTSCLDTYYTYQIEKYDPSTGTLVVWVKIPILSNAVDTDLHMYYGNSTIISDGSSDAVWDINYVSRYHLSEDPVMTTTDFTSNTNNGINNNLESIDLKPGKIGDAIEFDGTNESIYLGAANLVGNSYTLSAWIQSNQITTSFKGFLGSDSDPGYNRGPGMWVTENTRIHGGYGQTIGQYWCSWKTGYGAIVNDGITWNYLTYIYNGDDATPIQRLYIDGVEVLTAVNCYTTLGGFPSPVGSMTANDDPVSYIGRRNNFFKGMIDEVSCSDIVRSPEWILTEFNNQNLPATFYSIGTEQTIIDICPILLPIELLKFTAKLLDTDVALLEWITASEINNDYFTIEKSDDGITWEEISTINGAGNSSIALSYSDVDNSPLPGLSYYRLKQTDFDGNYTYSIPRSIRNENMNDLPLIIYPNPATDFVLIKGSSTELEQLRIINIIQQEVTYKTVITQINEFLYQIELINLSPGFYYIKTQSKTCLIFKD